MMINLRMLLVFAVTVCSCCPKIYPPSTNVKDSTIFHVRDSMVIRDSVVLVPIPAGESCSVQPADSSSHLETSVSISDAWIEDGLLHHTLRNKEALLPVEIKLPEHFHWEEARSQHAEKIIQKVEVEKQLSAWQNFSMVLGQICLAAIATWLAIMAYKRFR